MGWPRISEGAGRRRYPIAGQILAVVDVYDSLVEPRPYRERLPHDVAVTIIVEGRGTQFDKDVIEAFLTVEQEFQLQWTRLQARATAGTESVGA